MQEDYRHEVGGLMKDLQSPWRKPDEVSSHLSQSAHIVFVNNCERSKQIEDLHLR